MDFRKLLLYIVLILTTAMSIYAIENSEDDTAFGNKTSANDESYNITLLHSDIHLITNIEENNISFYGEYNASIRIEIAVDYIGVYLAKIKMNELVTTLFNQENSAIYRPINYTYINIGKNDRLKIVYIKIYINIDI